MGFFTHLEQPPLLLPQGRLLLSTSSRSWCSWITWTHRGKLVAMGSQCSAVGCWLPAQPGWEMERYPGFRAGHPCSSLQGLRKGRMDFRGDHAKGSSEPHRNTQEPTALALGLGFASACRMLKGCRMQQQLQSHQRGGDKVFPWLLGWEKEQIRDSFSG